MHTPANDTTVSSSKKASVLRCEMVNNAAIFLPATYSGVLDDKRNTTGEEHNSDPDHFDFENDDNKEANNNVFDDATNDSKARIILTHPFLFTSDQKWTITLLKLLNDMNAPDYACTAVLKLAQGASKEGYSFHPKGSQSCMQNIDVSFNSVKMQRLPTVKRVDVPHDPACNVITFKSAPQLLSLLQNSALMTAENLAIGIANPLAPYSSASLGEAMSGSVCAPGTSAQPWTQPQISTVFESEVVIDKGTLFEVVSSFWRNYFGCVCFLEVVSTLSCNLNGTLILSSCTTGYLGESSVLQVLVLS